MTTNKIEQNLFPGVPKIGQRVIVRSKENPDHVLQNLDNDRVFNSVHEAVKFLNSYGIKVDEVDLIDANTNLIL